MQVVEKMEDDRFESICDAGVELVKHLAKILQDRGLDLADASAVIAVANAGVVKGSNIKSSDMKEMVDSVIGYWREEHTKDGRGVVFDPPHRRPDFNPIVRNPSSEN